MIFTKTPLSGALLIDIKPIGDERGFFAYLFCGRQVAQHGLPAIVAQVKLSHNRQRGTLRGMHYQVPPAQESKLIRCIRGAVWDVIVDLREGSPTYLEHFGVELSADNRRALYVPPMFAHGYQTLTDDADVMYQVDQFYAPECERGLRHDDPMLELRWPLPVASISAKDQSWPLLDRNLRG